MIPDLIVSWPRHTDYPLFRRFIRDNRQRFARVLVAFTEHPGRDMREFVTRVMGPDVDCFNSAVSGDYDWRDAAVNQALMRSDAEWVWFTEQDFLIHEPARFWPAIDRGTATYLPVGFPEAGGSGRIHPASLFVPRQTVERTSRYFGQNPVDHFYRFGQELGRIWDINTDGGLVPPFDYEHLQGTTQNFTLIEQGIDAGVFRRDRFDRYLADCLAAGVELDPDWEGIARREIEGEWQSASS